MSYSGELNNDYYQRTTLSFDPGQSILMAGYYNAITVPSSAGSPTGLVFLSNAGFSEYFAIQVHDSSDRMRYQWPGLSQNGPADTVSADTWVLLGCFLPNGFDGTSQTVKTWFNSSTSSLSQTPPDYSSSTWTTCRAGDGISAISSHRGAYIGVWTGIDLTQANAIMASMLTTQPGAISPSPTLDFPFAAAAPAGFSPNGSVVIDSGENPTLSAGGGGSPRRAVALVI